ALDGLAKLEIGRGAERRLGPGRVDVPDERMSGRHARLVLDGARPALEDLGSKNGTRVNGRRVERAELDDGDLVEAGATFFVVQLGAAPGLAPAPRPSFRSLCQPLDADLRTLQRVARSAVPILLEGETGTGKEVLARAIHQESGRRGPLVVVNCGALPAPLVE